MSLSLSQRLQTLVDSYKQTLLLIQELQVFLSSQDTLPSDADEKRLELANTIHEGLKEQDNTLELLRQELDDDVVPTIYRGSATKEDRDAERGRNADLIARLTEDLKSARAKFRRAQLQSKRNIETVRRKEREQLFADRKSDVVQPRRQGHEKLTQDELARNASEDVTRALRRAHDLLQGNLTQSQFAQQTLDESQNALKDLSESYGGTGDLLKNSRSLVSQLVRSSKSDTWFLTTSFYILAATIAWLFFRRILYGPLWWLVWQPLRLMWWVTLSSLGTMGLGSSKSNSLSTGSTISTPTNRMEMPVSIKTTVPDEASSENSNSNPDSMIEKISHLLNNEETTYHDIDDLTEEERKLQEEQPRNPKKRMMEYEPDLEQVRDEL